MPEKEDKTANKMANKKRRMHHEVLNLCISRSTNYFGRAAKCICGGLSSYIFLWDKKEDRFIVTRYLILQEAVVGPFLLIFIYRITCSIVFSVIVQFIFRNDNYCATQYHEKKEIEIATGVQWQCSRFKSRPKNNKYTFLKIIIKIR